MPSHLYYPDDICWCSVSIYINAPETGSSANGVYWYAAMTDPDVTQIFGEWDTFEFGWH